MTATKTDARESAAPTVAAPRVVHAPLPPISDRKKLAMLAGGALGAAVAGMLTRNDPGMRPPADPEERRQPQAGGRGTRSLSLQPDSYSAEDHTVEAILSAGSPVARYYFTEI